MSRRAAIYRAMAALYAELATLEETEPPKKMPAPHTTAKREPPESDKKVDEVMRHRAKKILAQRGIPAS
jgi:hypothetical protein